VSLNLTAAAAVPIVSLACEGRQLTAQVPGFSPISSEDRFSLALDEEPVTLVADLSAGASGVTANGAFPEGFEAAFEKAEQIGALYGNQRIGPHPAPPEALKRQLLDACGA